MCSVILGTDLQPAALQHILSWFTSFLHFRLTRILLKTNLTTPRMNKLTLSSSLLLPACCYSQSHKCWLLPADIWLLNTGMNEGKEKNTTQLLHFRPCKWRGWGCCLCWAVVEICWSIYMCSFWKISRHSNLVMAACHMFPDWQMISNLENYNKTYKTNKNNQHETKNWPGSPNGPLGRRVSASRSC